MYLTSGSSDVNECLTGVHTCVFGQVCINTDGSFRCQREISCGTGYELRDDNTCQGSGKPLQRSFTRPAAPRSRPASPRRHRRVHPRDPQLCSRLRLHQHGRLVPLPPERAVCRRLHPGRHRQLHRSVRRLIVLYKYSFIFDYSYNLRRNSSWALCPAS